MGGQRAKGGRRGEAGQTKIRGAGANTDVSVVNWRGVGKEEVGEERREGSGREIS